MRGEGEIADIGFRIQEANSILGPPSIVIHFLRRNNYKSPTPRPGSAAKFVE
jgi:hypothetical protein